MQTVAIITYHDDRLADCTQVETFELKSVAIDRYADLKNDGFVNEATLYWVEAASSFDKTLSQQMQLELRETAGIFGASIFGACYNCKRPLDNLTTGVIVVARRTQCVNVCGDCLDTMLALDWREVARAQ